VRVWEAISLAPADSEGLRPQGTASGALLATDRWGAAQTGEAAAEPFQWQQAGEDAQAAASVAGAVTVGTQASAAGASVAAPDRTVEMVQPTTATRKRRVLCALEESGRW